MRGITATARRLQDGRRIVAGRGRAGRYAVVMAAVAFAYGCADAGAGDQSTMAVGYALYQANCVACHGEDARGGGPMARALPVQPPSILEHLGHHTQAELTRLIQGGIPPAMPPTPLSEEEIHHIVDYVWTLVPESEVGALRAMQQQTERLGEPTIPPMDHSQHMQGSAPAVDHSQHMQGSAPAVDHSQHMQQTTPEVDHSQHMRDGVPEVDHSQHAPG
jgi:mono/diheme cytochrome c family protein